MRPSSTRSGPRSTSSPATRASTASTCSTAGERNLTVTLNETGTSSVTITAVNFTNADAAPLAINAAANNWATTANITAARTDLTAALTTLRSQSQSFGSSLSTVQIRQDFTKAMVNTLQTGADALTLADSNEEGANLLALQTRQQLSTTALSLASQASQSRAPPVPLIAETTSKRNGGTQVPPFSFGAARNSWPTIFRALSDPKVL